MLPILVIVGRPNVGKSTLFNRLTKSRAALVADFPGLTRDRHYGRGRSGERRFIVVDTGGFEPVAKTGILHEMAKQTRAAIAEADAVDIRRRRTRGPHRRGPRNRTAPAADGPAGVPRRQQGRRACLPDAPRPSSTSWRSASRIGISAAHGENVDAVTELALSSIPESAPDDEAPAGPDKPVKVAVIGRPNVGKSTLINTLLGEERVIAFDEPGTTRDSIYLDFERNGRRYTLIDTAGVRRRGKVFEAVEKFSVVKTLQAIEDANVVVLMFDAERRRHRAGRASRGLHPRGGTRARGRHQQVGRSARRPSRRRQARSRSEGWISLVRSPAFHLGARPAPASRA